MAVWAIHEAALDSTDPCDVEDGPSSRPVAAVLAREVAVVRLVEKKRAEGTLALASCYSKRVCGLAVQLTYEEAMEDTAHSDVGVGEDDGCGKLPRAKQRAPLFVEAREEGGTMKGETMELG